MIKHVQHSYARRDMLFEKTLMQWHLRNEFSEVHFLRNFSEVHEGMNRSGSRAK